MNLDFLWGGKGLEFVSYQADEIGKLEDWGFAD